MAKVQKWLINIELGIDTRHEIKKQCWTSGLLLTEKEKVKRGDHDGGHPKDGENANHGRHHHRRPGRETSSAPQAFSFFFYLNEFNKEKDITQNSKEIQMTKEKQFQVG